MSDSNVILLLSRIADTLERLESRLEELTERYGNQEPRIRVDTDRR